LTSLSYCCIFTCSFYNQKFTAMRKLIITLFMGVLIISVQAQIPQTFNYQAVVRDGYGEIIANQDVSFRISILKDTPGGIIIYQEMHHNMITNGFGLVTLEIGIEEPAVGTFSEIDWGNGSYFLQLELDETGGTNWQTMGTSQLLTVPYALYSTSTGDTTRWMKGNDNALYYDKGNIGIGTSTPLWSANLDIRGMDTDDGGVVNIGNADNTHKLTFFSGRENDPNPFLRWSDGDPFRFATNAGDFFWDELMRITSDGKVGIGTDTPYTDLDIKSDSITLESKISLRNLDNSNTLYLSSGSENWDPYLSFKGGDALRVMRYDEGLSELMCIQNDGHVGIGTSTPTFNLDIMSNSTDFTSRLRLANSDDSKNLRFSSGSDNYDPYVAFTGGNALRFVNFDQGFKELMRIQSDGKVGIGTDEPWVNLDVRGNDADDGAVFSIGNIDNTNRLSFFSGRQNDPNPFVRWTAGSPLRFSTDEEGWSEKMRMTGDGKLAIGTIDPLGNIDIHGTDSARIYISPAGIANSLSTAIMFRSTFGGDVPDLGPRNTALIKAHFDGGGWETAALAFHVAGSDCMLDTEADPCERLRITSEGLIGIGTTTPWYRIDVRGYHVDHGSALSLGNSDLSHQLVLYGGREGDPNPYIMWKAGDPLRFSTDEFGWSEQMRISADGNVGIGIDNPIQKLEVEGNIKMVDGNQASGRIMVSNDNGTGTWTDPADIEQTTFTDHQVMDPFLAVNYIIAVNGLFPSQGGGLTETPFIGQITLFAGNFAPSGWEFCDGQLLNIASYAALFSIIGTIYGGDGRTTFALPDLRGRNPIQAGQGEELTNRPLGSKGGEETITVSDKH